jgi:hypothetical protein
MVSIISNVYVKNTDVA